MSSPRDWVLLKKSSCSPSSMSSCCFNLDCILPLWCSFKLTKSESVGDGLCVGLGFLENGLVL
jgi:hypothetical protein